MEGGPTGHRPLKADGCEPQVGRPEAAPPLVRGMPKGCRTAPLWAVEVTEARRAASVERGHGGHPVIQGMPQGAIADLRREPPSGERGSKGPRS